MNASSTLTQAFPAPAAPAGRTPAGTPASSHAPRGLAAASHPPAQVAASHSPGHAAATRQYLVFALNAEIFAIDIHNVREIIEYGQLTVVPMMPPAVRGVINLRGAVVPVIDLSARFGRAPTQASRRTCIVIAEVAQHDAAAGDGRVVQTLGLVVDAVNAVTEIPPEDIEPAPAFGTRIRTDFIAGMARQQDRFVILLSIDRVLSLDELAGLAALTEAAA